MRSNSALGIIFRVPEYGKVKKRLASQIGKEEALRVYSAMLRETLKKALELTDISLYGFYEGTLSSMDKLLDGLSYIPQSGRDLGERMLSAVNLLFGEGFRRVVLIGADSPDLPIDFIRDAFLILKDYELVIGPTEDGGYYLIGLSRPIRVIFRDIPWGSCDVLEKTLSVAQKEGITYHLIPKWYDIDKIEDLRRWKGFYF